MDNVRLAPHGDMGRERCKGLSRTGLSGAVLADDSLLTINALVKIRTESVACNISGTSGPQLALGTSIAGAVGNLRPAAPSANGRKRCKCDSPTHLFGAVSDVGSLLSIQGTT
ncbi:hypothetical protein MTO96_012756 [Rhipicephalus appendiculatus]